MERYWVWEYGLFEKNPKQVDSLNPETTLEVVKLADAQAAVEALQAQLTQRTAELAAAKKVKADYDRWLSRGVYFTTAEYMAHLDKHRADLEALQRERDRLRANLVNCVARLEAYYGEDYPAVRDAKAALTPAGGGKE